MPLSIDESGSQHYGEQLRCHERVGSCLGSAEVSGRSNIDEFLESYRQAFTQLNAEAIARLFAYPCQLTSDAGEIEVTVVPTGEAWLPQIERLVAAYQAVGVRAAEIIERRAIELTPQLAQVVVHWALRDAADTPIYDFDAAYTIADLGRGFRIIAIAHNETQRLRAALDPGR